MTSTVEVKRSEAGGRDVYSISKTYRGEEHEVIFPLNQDIQVLVNLISTINEGKDKADQFVLMRRNAVGRDGDGVNANEQAIKQTAVQSIVQEFYGEDTAERVTEVIND